MSHFARRKHNIAYRYISIWIPLLFLLVAFFASYFHDTFEEWDGVMQFFAGKEIFMGYGYKGWTSHFWPPLYSLLIGLGALILPGFYIAKAISVISGMITLLIVYHFAIELSGSKKAGLLTQLFLFINPLFFISTIQAENHMIDTLFFVGTIFLIYREINIRKINYKQFVIIGLFAGLAGLSRYTSYALVPIVIGAILLFNNIKKASKLIFAFIIGFIAISLPWWVYNTAINGSPLHTWQYMNIGSHVFPNRLKWWWQDQANFDGVINIVTTNPLHYAKNFVYNIINSGKLIILNLGILAPISVPTFYDSFYNVVSNF